VSEKQADYAGIRAVEFEAEVRKITSLVDHTYNLTLNVPEYHIEKVKAMLGWLGDQVRIVITTV